VIVIQNEEPVAVAANSGVDAGLDKPEKQPGSDQGKDVAFADLSPRGPSRDVSNADAVADGDDRMSPPRGENSENETNEANVVENVITVQNKEPVGVAANSGVDSELDNREERPGRAEGKEVETRELERRLDE